MVVERMNELSIMVEWVVPPCVLAVRCTTWINFMDPHSTEGSVSLLGGATSSTMLRGDLKIKCILEELDDGAFDDRFFLGKTLVAIFHIVVALTHNECTRISCQWEKHTREVYGVMEIIVNFLYYYCWRVVSEVHMFVWKTSHRVYGYLIMQPPIKVKLNQFIKVST
jgi:hypothetical protein